MMFDPCVVLDREKLDFDPDGGYLSGKRVLVTGAGGSIGSVLCSALAAYDPAELIMLDRDETALQRTQLEIHGHGLLTDDSTVLCDIRDKGWLSYVFSRRRPEIVFHAAALKHQPMLERFPGEAVKTNIFGTRNVLGAAVTNQVKTLVSVSTDKAADPSCVLGASKRIAERLTAWWLGQGFVSVRFGNVFNSSGSVLEVFTRQLNSGVPLTITDPDADRLFLMADEAAQLLIYAGSPAASGPLMVPKMGDPVRIADIAERMIKIFGCTLLSPAKIEYTGLRPGEKLHEVRLGSSEVEIESAHPLVSNVAIEPLIQSMVDRLEMADSCHPGIRDELMTLCDWSARDSTDRNR